MRSRPVTWVFVLSSVLGVVGCGASPTPVAKPAEESKEDKSAAKLDADDDRTVVLLEEMGDIMDGNKNDCDAMADGLEAYNAKNRKELKALEVRMQAKKDDAARDEAFKAKYGHRMEVATKKMMSGGLNCKDSDRVLKAMKDE